MEKEEKKNELVSIGMVIIHAEAKEYVVFAKRVCRGKDAAGKTVKSGLKVEFKAGVPENDEQAKAMYGCSLADLVKKGILEKSHSLNKTDALMSDYKGEALIDGMAALAAADFATVGRAPGVASEQKAKAAKFDALKAKFGMTDEEIEAVLAHAQKKGTPKK